MGPPEIAGYELRHVLGHGSGGEVWLASDRATGEAVAVKCVRPGADIETRDRLRREAAVLAGMDHPHVLRLRAVVGVAGSGDEVALVLDLATGGSLARLVARRGPLSAGEVVTVLVPLAEALADVHAGGVVHGDVTPANVLFTGDGRPVLADLGVARLVAGADPGPAAGTPGFRDPHQGWGADPAGDVYGLAATCVLALTGHPPAGDDSAGDTSGGGRDAASATRRGPLLTLLERVLAAPPVERPGARELARLAYAGCPAEPVRLEPGALVDPLVGPELGAPLTVVSSRPRPLPVPPLAPAAARGPGTHRRVSRRSPALLRRWRQGVAVLVGAVAVATAAVTGIAWAGSGEESAPARVLASTAGAPPGSPPPGAAPAPSPAPGSATESETKTETETSTRTAGEVAAAGSWAAVLASLDAERSAAYATGDLERLGRVYTAGSPAGRRDRAALAGLRGAGLRAEGMRLQVLRVAELRRTEQHVRLRVVDVLRRHRLVDGSGAVVERRPGRTSAVWSVTLARDEGRWRVYDVTRE